MIPMIDMLFLLLIFFLVAAKWRPQENFLPFRLSPPTATAQGPQPGRPEPMPIYITAIDNGCEIRIGRLPPIKIEDKKFEEDLAGFPEQMQKALTGEKRTVSDPVEIICSPKVKWEHLAKIYNLFFGSGISDITFRTAELSEE